ncbi:hypothetical protein DFH07DRAFT_358602 [Mycena maculata]|uniref:Uncharacterized protein n=1 Tax=Mycena maculata TaxID=230809 RepID=A0AAD7NL78_9AGAR|nr:hypothetical protein DFH07DRAFT_358602 [Mycena maculata]
MQLCSDSVSSRYRPIWIGQFGQEGDGTRWPRLLQTGFNCGQDVRDIKGCPLIPRDLHPSQSATTFRMSHRDPRKDSSGYVPLPGSPYSQRPLFPQSGRQVSPQHSQVHGSPASPRPYVDVDSPYPYPVGHLSPTLVNPPYGPPGNAHYPNPDGNEYAWFPCHPPIYPYPPPPAGGAAFQRPIPHDRTQHVNVLAHYSPTPSALSFGSGVALAQLPQGLVSPGNAYNPSSSLTGHSSTTRANSQLLWSFSLSHLATQPQPR